MIIIIIIIIIINTVLTIEIPKDIMTIVVSLQFIFLFISHQN